MDRIAAQSRPNLRNALGILILLVAMAGSSTARAQTGSIGANFFTVDRTTTGTVSGFLIEPPDTTGAIGLNHFIAFNNGSFGIFNKSGGLVSRISDGAFWTNAGVSITTANLSDPRILYD